jgi:hypothetical protein
MRRCGFFMLFALIALSSQVAVGRAPIWQSYEHLAKNADVIAIAIPVEGVAAKVDLAVDPDWKPLVSIPEFAAQAAQVMRGHKTTFKVRSVLKGEAKTETISVVYAVAVREIDFMINGPFVVKHSLLTTVGKVPSASNDAFLLFLKKQSDGTYAPACGYFDTAFSFQKLQVQ